MLATRYLLCLFLFVSSAGFAQAPEDAPSAASEAPEAPPLVPAPGESDAPRERPPEGKSFPYEYKPQHQPPKSPLARILVETAAGAGVAVATSLATVTTLIVMFALGAETIEAYAPVIGVGSLVLFGGTPLAVYGVGRAMGGHGSYLASLLGTVVGTVVGVLGAIPIIQADDRGGALSTFIMAAGFLGGTVAGYEISHHLNQPESPPSDSEYDSARPRFQVMPMVSVTREGGILGGLVGRF